MDSSREGMLLWDDQSIGSYGSGTRGVLGALVAEDIPIGFGRDTCLSVHIWGSLEAIVTIAVEISHTVWICLFFMQALKTDA